MHRRLVCTCAPDYTDFALRQCHRIRDLLSPIHPSKHINRDLILMCTRIPIARTPSQRPRPIERVGCSLNPVQSSTIGERDLSPLSRIGTLSPFLRPLSLHFSGATSVQPGCKRATATLIPGRIIPPALFPDMHRHIEEPADHPVGQHLLLRTVPIYPPVLHHDHP